MGPEDTVSQDQSTDSNESTLERVEREHRRVLTAVKALRRQLREIDQVAQAAEQQRIRDEISAFMEMVRGHERAETRLVADTCYLEEGGSG